MRSATRRSRCSSPPRSSARRSGSARSPLLRRCHVGLQKSVSTRSSARTSSGARAALRSQARTSSRFATCSSETSRTGRSRAPSALMEAGDRASGLTSFLSAARLYEQALELLPEDDARRADLLLRLGRALQYTADEGAERVLEDASRALLGAGRRESAAEAQTLLSVVWWDRGKRDRSAEHLDQARRLIGAEASETRAQVLARFARAQTIAGEYDEAIPAATEALAIGERLGLDG